MMDSRSASKGERVLASLRVKGPARVMRRPNFGSRRVSSEMASAVS